jgi:cytochrome P450
VYNLARNPDKQEKVSAEIQEVLQGKSQVTSDDIDKMHYLKAAVKESFR